MIDHGEAIFHVLGVDIDTLAHAAAETGTCRVPGFPVRLAVRQVIDPAQVAQLVKSKGFIIPEDKTDFSNVSGADLYGQLAGFELVPENSGAQTLAQMGEKRIHGHNGGHREVKLPYLLIVLVPVRLIFFCNCNTPNNRASAVGGQPGT